MDRKELYQNVRKAYRLAYEVQHSIVEMVDYIRTRIKYSEIAGKQLFSASIGRHIPALDDYADQKFTGCLRSWDYFPTYMYMYYFTGIPTETKYSCFSIVQVMDDGFLGTTNVDSAPETKDFNTPAESESYVLLSFAIWNKNRRAIWFEYDGTDVIQDEKAEIMRISQVLKGNGGEPYVKKVPDAAFVVSRINLESMCSKAEVDHVLQAFADLVEQETGYQILLDETEEENTHP
jgi:hypothetical protein